MIWPPQGPVETALVVAGIGLIGGLVGAILGFVSNFLTTSRQLRRQQRDIRRNVYSNYARAAVSCQRLTMETRRLNTQLDAFRSQLRSLRTTALRGADYESELSGLTKSIDELQPKVESHVAVMNDAITSLDLLTYDLSLHSPVIVRDAGARLRDRLSDIGTLIQNAATDEDYHQGNAKMRAALGDFIAISRADTHSPGHASIARVTARLRRDWHKADQDAQSRKTSDPN